MVMGSFLQSDKGKKRCNQNTIYLFIVRIYLRKLYFSFIMRRHKATDLR